jgi:hypothetical protein
MKRAGNSPFPLGKYTMFTDMKTRLERAGHCQRCEHYRRTIKQCAQCGCLVNLKVTIANEACPIGKWTEASPGNDFVAEISKTVQGLFKPKN